METISNKLTNPKLYQQISDFSIDEPTVALPFSKRLARENNWSLKYSLRVIAEYKRFAYLCITSGHMCSPSEDVDQAWHLHMLYTSSYFTRFCGEVLGQTLAHEPTKGGKDEGEKFTNWYEKTKEAYRREFGEEPPADIWPSSEARFKPQNFARVNTGENWVIPKRKLTRLAFPSVASAAFLILIGCTAASQSLDFGSIGIVFLIAFGLIALIVFLSVLNGQGNSKDRKDNGGGCSSGSSGCGSSGSGCSSDSGSDGGSSGCGGGGCGGGCGGGGD